MIYLEELTHVLRLTLYCIVYIVSCTYAHSMSITLRAYNRGEPAVSFR